MDSNHLNPHYDSWRTSRIKKLERLFGREYFKNKIVLEVGAGFGEMGRIIGNWGAIVYFTEVRDNLIDIIKQHSPDNRVFKINHEEEWELKIKFDFIIHWGLLYHLQNWKADLSTTIRHLNKDGILCLESEVLDSLNDTEIKINENRSHDDQSANGIGTRMSAVSVEKLLKKNGLKYTRYDDADLNASFHKYDWVEMNNNKWHNGQRRFWVCQQMG